MKWDHPQRRNYVLAQQAEGILPVSEPLIDHHYSALGEEDIVVNLDSEKSSCTMDAETKAAAYCLLNVLSTVGIVFANKLALDTYGFRFPIMLTWYHTAVTAVGMHMMSKFGVFEPRRLPLMRILPLSAAYVGFIVSNNISIQINTVGFYQIMKIAIAPMVIFIEAIWYCKRPSRRTLTSVAVLLAGITTATVTDKQVSSNPLGVMVAMVATVLSALYQIWAGTKQKELQANAMQLLHQATPLASIMLMLIVPLVEPVGWTSHGPSTLLGFAMTWQCASAIIASSLLGLLVTLSTFLVIGATSSLTYNVVGHFKTVTVVVGGWVIFGDAMGVMKLMGLVIAMTGIVWYTNIRMIENSLLSMDPPPNSKDLPK